MVDHKTDTSGVSVRVKKSRRIFSKSCGMQNLSLLSGEIELFLQPLPKADDDQHDQHCQDECQDDVRPLAGRQIGDGLKAEPDAPAFEIDQAISTNPIVSGKATSVPRIRQKIATIRNSSIVNTLSAIAFLLSCDTF